MNQISCRPHAYASWPWLLLLLPFLCLVSGCRSFEKDWAAASLEPGRITGRWIGTWQNTNNTHSGPLRAVITQQDADTFRARFHAGWGKRSGSFRTRLSGHWEGDTFHFTGRRRIFFIPVTTAGTATPDRLDSGYDSPVDQGTFTLRRE